MKRQTYIYIISNTAFEGYLKIGKTIDIEKRLSSYQTADPLRRYKLEFIVPVTNHVRYEKFFKEYSNSNEWTQLNLSECIRIISSIKTDEDKRFTNQVIIIDGVEFPVKSYRNN